MREMFGIQLSHKRIISTTVMDSPSTRDLYKRQFTSDRYLDELKATRLESTILQSTRPLHGHDHVSRFNSLHCLLGHRRELWGINLKNMGSVSIGSGVR